MSTLQMLAELKQVAAIRLARQRTQPALYPQAGQVLSNQRFIPGGQVGQ